MPLYYQGIHQEVAAVRTSVGLFDVSHMGRIWIRGKDTLSFLEKLSTNTVIDKPLGKAFYTIFCNHDGYAIDDLLVYLVRKDEAFLIVNASNREIDLNHILRESGSYEVTIEAQYQTGGILSLQGPKSHEILRGMPTLAPFQFAEWQSGITVSRTGYTGEEGYEFYGSDESIKALWNMLLDKGAIPCGLGCRDILRLEKGYALYGHELSLSVYPLESVARWAVKLDAHEFLGKEALLHAQKRGPLRHPIALQGLEKIPAREGYLIYYLGKKIGVVTSGTFSSTIGHSIALGLVDEPLPENVQVDVKIRADFHPFQIIKLPFIK